jgi:protein SCO1/2
MKRLAPAAALLVLAGCGGAGSHGAGLSGTSPLPPGLSGRPAPPITGRAARGGTFSTASLHGRPYAVTFLYANCRDTCPLIAQELSDALRDLGADARRVAVVAVSVDPRGDTPKVVQAFLRRHHAPANFRYLIGSRDDLAPIWHAYYAAPQVPGDPRSSHTATVWLVGPDGRLAADIGAGSGFRPHDVTHDFRVLLERR